MLSVILAVLLNLPEMTPPYVPKAEGADPAANVRVMPEFRADGVIAGPKTLRANDKEEFIVYSVAGRVLFRTVGRFAPSPRWQPFHFFKGGLTDNGSRHVRTAYPFAVVDDAHPRGIFTTTMDCPVGDRVRLGFHADVGTNDLSNVRHGEIIEFNLSDALAKDARIVADGKETDLEGLKRMRKVRRVEFRERETGALLVALEPDPETVAGFGGWKDALRLLPTKEPCKPMFMTVDMGETWMPKNAPKLVAGIDFWAENEYRVAQYPARNFLMNPGFVGGLRYWKTTPSVDPATLACADKDMPPELPKGHRALHLTQPITSVGVVLKPATAYTVSAWLKSDSPQRSMTVAVEVGGVHGTSRMAGSVRLSARNEWQRRSGTFVTPADQADTYVLLAPWAQKGWIAGVQLEEGTNVTAYCGNPIGLDLVTDAAQRGYADIDKPIHARLRVCGPAGTKGRLSVSAADLLKRPVMKGDFPFALGADGTVEIPLGPDAQWHRGPNALTVKVETAFGTYEDYLRLTAIRPRDGRDPLRFMQGTARYSFFMPNEMMPAYEFERLRDFGLGGINYPGNPTGGPDERFTAKDYANLDRYGLRDTWGGLRWSSGWKAELNGKPIPKEILAADTNAETYSDEFLQYWEENAYEAAKRHPLQTYWSFDSEPAEHHASLKNQNFREYAKWMLAINRGLKKANPKNVFCPYGSWNMFKGGSDNIYEFLVASTLEDPKTRWEAMEVHSYRELPEHPDVERDLLYLFDAMKAAGYPDIPLKVGEGSYYYPMWRPSMNLFAWTGVGGKDGYNKILALGYDLGWGERIGAALILREQLVFMKYRDRITSNCSWCPPVIDNFQPFAWLSMQNALMELLGDARHVKDVRFSRDGRAMVFDDGKGSTVAVVWNASARYDMAVEKGLVVNFDFGETAPRLFDIMGNECEVKRIPLNGFPFYLKVAKADGDKLVAALEGAGTPGVARVEKKPFVDPVAATGIVKSASGDATKGVMPDWSKVPKRELGSIRGDENGKSSARGASVQFAWNEKGLYVRVVVKGKTLCVPPPDGKVGWKSRGDWDCVKLAFDGYANAREKLSEGFRGNDFDDFVYCLYPTNATSAVCWRRRAPDHQLTGGAGHGLLPEVFEPLVRTSFRAKDGDLVYEASFPARAMMPVVLKAGNEFGLVVEVTDRATAEAKAARLYSTINRLWWTGPERFEKMRMEKGP